MTSAVLVLASWLAQAGDPGRAPPEPPGPPIPRAPIDGGAPDPANAFALQARFAYRRASGGPNLDPAAGFSLGASFERRYATFGPGIELGAGLDLFHDRFQLSVLGSSLGPSGVEETFDGQRLVTQTSFAALQTLGLPIRRARLWAAAGGGVTIAFFSSPERDLRPGSTSAVQPLARGAVGVDVRIRGRAGLVVRADYTHLFTHPTFVSDAGLTYSPFGDLFDVGVGLTYRF